LQIRIEPPSATKAVFSCGENIRIRKGLIGLTWQSRLREKAVA
jgi:hypothetical protein